MYLIAIQEIAVSSTAMTHTYWTAPIFPAPALQLADDFASASEIGIQALHGAKLFTADEKLKQTYKYCGIETI